MIEVNLKNNAPSIHTLPFNSMCKIGDVYLGASGSGLYQLSGSNDNGTSISASIKSGEMDFGYAQKKRFRFFYFGVNTTGSLLLKVYCDGTLAASMTVRPEGSGEKTIRVPISREHVGRYWAWSIENVNGSDFTLYSVQAIPVIMHPNRGQ